jgi:hypothetical protein
MVEPVSLSHPQPDRVADTIDEFCDSVRIKRTKAYAEIKEGRLKKTKISGRTVILRSDREAWLRRLQGERV